MPIAADDTNLVPVRRRLWIIIPWSLPGFVGGIIMLVWLHVGHPPHWAVWGAPFSYVVQMVGFYFLWREERRMRAYLKAGRCLACGYDLRAGPDAGGPLLPRCPECGSESKGVAA